MLIELTREQKEELLDSIQPELLVRIKRITSDTYQKDMEAVINNWFLKIDKDNVNESFVFKDALTKAVKEIYQGEIRKQVEFEKNNILELLRESVKNIALDVLNDKNMTPEKYVKNAMIDVLESIIKDQYSSNYHENC